jgi:hypothetical protein
VSADVPDVAGLDVTADLPGSGSPLVGVGVTPDLSLG